jgi:hypothetical protein
MRDLLLLTDEAGRFLLSMRGPRRYESMDVPSLCRGFAARGYRVTVRRFSELRPGLEVRGWPVVYQSSESFGLFYKGFIEDTIRWLERQGAQCLPCHEHLRAHHNKVWMEMLRSTFRDAGLRTLGCRWFGSAGEACAHPPARFPVVVKASAGSGGTDVTLARDLAEYESAVHDAARVFCARAPRRAGADAVKRTLRAAGLPVSVEPRPELKLVVQDYVPGLDGDWKVLAFGRKFYTLRRRNRTGDFRASGSGRFAEAEEAPSDLLAFAWRVVQELDTPIVGMDIAFDGIRHHLLEFQMLHLGPYTLQAATSWHENRDGRWERCEGRSKLEEEYCDSVHGFLEGRARGGA